MSRRSLHSPARVKLNTNKLYYPRSAAMPPPSPPGFVGVPTLTKINSASRMAPSTSALKKRFLLRTDLITSQRPGSKIGRFEVFQASIRETFESTTVTLMCGFFKAMIAQVGAPIIVPLITSKWHATDITRANTGDASDAILLDHFRYILHELNWGCFWQGRWGCKVFIGKLGCVALVGSRLRCPGRMGDKWARNVDGR